MELGRVKGVGGDRCFVGAESLFFLEGTCYLKELISPLQGSLND